MTHWTDLAILGTSVDDDVHTHHGNLCFCGAYVGDEEWLEHNGEGADSAFAFFARPLTEACDSVDRARAFAMVLWIAAKADAASREEFFLDLREALGLADSEFETLRQEILDPMIRRHFLCSESISSCGAD